MKLDKRRRTAQEEVVVFRQRWFPNAHPVPQKQKLQISADGSKLGVRQATALWRLFWPHLNTEIWIFIADSCLCLDCVKKTKNKTKACQKALKPKNLQSAQSSVQDSLFQVFVFNSVFLAETPSEASAFQSRPNWSGSTAATSDLTQKMFKLQDDYRVYLSAREARGSSLEALRVISELRLYTSCINLYSSGWITENVKTFQTRKNKN